MAVNGGELIDPFEIARMHIHIAEFLSEQALAGADMDVLADLGYPPMDGTADFEVHAEVRTEGWAAGDDTDRQAEPETTEASAASAAPANPAAGKAPAGYKGRRKSRRPRDLAAGDMRPDLKPFPYGTKED